MQGASRLIAASLVAIMLAGCGQSTQAAHSSSSVVRHHGPWTMSVTWENNAGNTKATAVTLRISPTSAVPETAILTMSDGQMHMGPFRVQWHQVKPGEYHGSATVAMGGRWNLTVPLHSRSSSWRTAFPISVHG